MIQAREDSWVKITADGKPVKRSVLSAHKKMEVRAREKIIVVAGNAGGVDVSFNGKHQPALGNENQVRTATFTPEECRSRVVTDRAFSDQLHG